jgi:hypothetical protein
LFPLTGAPLRATDHCLSFAVWEKLECIYEAGKNTG